MKKWLLSLCMVLALVACKDEKKGTEQAKAKPVIKIGVSLPLTGDMGNIGAVLKGSVDIAQQDLMARNLKNQYQFVIEDHAFDIKKVVLVNQKLLTVDKVDAIIDFASKIGLVTSPIAEQNKIIHISSCASDPQVAEGKYNFIHWTQTADETKKLVEKIIKEGLDNIVIFTAVDQATLEISTNLQNLLKEHGIAFKEIRTNPKETDLNLILNTVSAENTGLYVLLEYSPTLDIILKRLKEHENTVPVTSIETFSFLDNKDVVEGYWFVDAAELSNDNYERFTSYNKSENIFGVGNTYDAIMLLVDAFEKADTKEQAVEKLSEIKTYHGVVGKLHQDEKGIFNSEAILKKIVDGKVIKIED